MLCAMGKRQKKCNSKMGTVSETIRVASIMGGVPVETRLERWSHLMEWADTSCGMKLLDPAFEEENA